MFRTLCSLLRKRTSPIPNSDNPSTALSGRRNKEESMAPPNWSALVFDLLVEISTRVSSVEDFMAFRGVCSSWRDAGNLGSRRSTASGAPLLMLAEKDDSDEREFYSLSKRKVSMRLPLPEAKGKRCIEARFGWLLTTANSGEANLLNPFSRVRIDLPDYTAFPRYAPGEPNLFVVERATLSANPSHSSDFMLFVVLDGMLGFWRPGDQNWTQIGSNLGDSSFENICYCNQELYMVDDQGSVMIRHPSIMDDFEEILTVDYEIVAYKNLYLVESSSCAGELLLVVRHCADDGGEGSEITYGTTLFEVIRIDVMRREWEVIGGLEKEAVFLGRNAAVCIPADVIKPNCIYFTDDNFEDFVEYFSWKGKGGEDMGVYDLEDGSIERFSIESLSHISPPLWIDSSIGFSKIDQS